MNADYKTNFAFGYLPATVAVLTEILRAGFGTKAKHPSCGRCLMGSFSTKLQDGPSNLETCQGNTEGNN